MYREHQFSPKWKYLEYGRAKGHRGWIVGSENGTCSALFLVPICWAGFTAVEQYAEHATHIDSNLFLMWIERCWFVQTRVRSFPNVEAALPCVHLAQKRGIQMQWRMIQGSRTFQLLGQLYRWWWSRGRGRPEGLLICSNLSSCQSQCTLLQKNCTVLVHLQYSAGKKNLHTDWIFLQRIQTKRFYNLRLLFRI